MLTQQVTAVNTAEVIICGGLYTLGFFTLYGIISENKLMTIKGKTSALNKQKMISVLKETYRTDMIYEGSEMLSYYRRATFWRFALRIIVLFNQDKVLINISRFNQRGLKSFFHPLFSQIQVRLLTRKFESEAD